MSLNNVEKFKEKICKRKVCVGIPISSADPVVSELVAEAGYDFTWIDMEHSPMNIETALAHVMAVRGTNTAPLIRVPFNDPVTLKPILELEPAGVIIPLIRTAEDAANAVKACKYPPKGIRGYGPRRGTGYGAQDMMTYLEDADDRMMVIVQIEHTDAVDNIDSILAIEGLDGICIGPNDLSGSYGVLGQIDHPDVRKAINLVIQKIKKTSLFFGVATGYDAEKTKWWLSQGIQWIALNGDYVNMYHRCKEIIDNIKAFEIL